MKDTPRAIETWKGQLEGLGLYSSYQDAAGIDGEAIEFKWTVFTGFSSLSVLEKPKKTWRRGESSQKSSQTGSSPCQSSMTLYGTQMIRIVFQKPKKRFLAGHWTFLGPGTEEKWYGSTDHDEKGHWNCTANKMVQQFKETGHLVFKGVSALRRGVLKQKKGKTSIHFNGDSMNTELLFQTVHSVNQLSVNGVTVGQQDLD